MRMGKCVSNVFCPYFWNKCLKSLHSCVPVICSSSMVIVEFGQKQHSSLHQQRKSSIIGGSSLKHLEQNHTKLQVNSNLLYCRLCFATQCWPNVMNPRKHGLLLMGGFQCFLVGCYSKLCCHLCCATETWALGDGRVYSAVNHHVWCGLSGRVRGEMPAKCSHHDLMRWFSCSSAPSAVLCNSETSTQQFPWPACVTSAFVHIRHVAHNPVKHVGRLLR